MLGGERLLYAASSPGSSSAPCAAPRMRFPCGRERKSFEEPNQVAPEASRSHSLLP